MRPVVFSKVDLVGLAGVGCGSKEIGTGVCMSPVVFAEVDLVGLVGVGCGSEEMGTGVGQHVSRGEGDKASGFFLDGTGIG